MLNIVDIIIIAFTLIFLRHAWKSGFWIVTLDLISFFLTLIISFRAYPLVSDFLRNHFNIGRSIGNAVSFLASAFFVELIFSYIASYIVYKIPNKYKNGKFLKTLALIPGFGQSVIISAFFLTLIFSFPIAPKIKIEIDSSKIGSYLIKNTSNLESSISGVFGDIARDSLTNLVVEPESHESVALDVATLDPSIDEETEKKMFVLINHERETRGIKTLKWRNDLVPVARAHALDMWERKYFGHYSPEGKNVGDRLEAASVRYFTAGENLALSPTLDIAHTGLMNSPGHRANILSEDFTQVGIGVVDNGFYGKMFVQIFTD